MKVLVCGSRNYDDTETLFNALTALHRERPITEIIEGDAHGADRLAGVWARMNGIRLREFPADWVRYGRAAGPIRNKQMLVEGQPDLVVAFPKDGNISTTKGTKNMVLQAQNAHIETIIHGGRP